ARPQAPAARLGRARVPRRPADPTRPDAVLDSLPLPLLQRRRKAHVEALRLHADRPGRVEVAGLVNQPQEPEAEDADQNAHAVVAVRWARRRASASASISSVS